MKRKIRLFYCLLLAVGVSAECLLLASAPVTANTDLTLVEMGAHSFGMSQQITEYIFTLLQIFLDFSF